jgi:DNA-binding transcriptional ArsR family regulator
VAHRKRKDKFLSENLVRAVNDPLRREILEVLGEREASPKELEGVLGVDLHKVAYHTKILFECEVIERTRKKPRRGAVENFYRAVPESYIGHRLWRDVPGPVKATVVFVSLKDFIRKLTKALKAGTLRSDETSLSAMTLTLDAQGQKEANGVMQGALEQLKRVDEASRKRAAQGDSSLTAVLGGVALFELSPGSDV